MKNKEIKVDNISKISIPLITNAELNAIDNNLDDFVNQFTQQVIHDKDLLVAQHIIKRQKQYIDQLENKVKNMRKEKRRKEKMFDRDIINAENLFIKLGYSKIWCEEGFYYYNSNNNKVILFNLKTKQWSVYDYDTLETRGYGD